MNGLWLFIGLVFLAVFLLSQGMIVPVFGEARKTRKRLRERVNAVAAAMPQGELASLLRAKYLNELSPFERYVELLPGMEKLAKLIEQTGRSTPAYRIVLISMVLATGAGMCAWMLTRQWQMSAFAVIAGAALPLAKILRDRTTRMAKFEEQIPEAMDVIKRALRAGHPFNQSLKLVAEDMSEPISREFDLVFAEINYGGDVRRAMLGLLERMPSVSVMALTTAVLVQKETGGNLAETLERITGVIRSRFKLHRRVRTLSAEGRLSGWILALVPLVLFAVIWVTTPSYLPTLLENPMGQKLITAAIVLATAGIFWIRRVIRIEV